MAASDAFALRFEQLQTKLGEGPCVAAYGTGVAVSVPDLGKDRTFPAFVRRGSDAGLRAVFTFPLRHGADRLGALNLYRSTPGRLTPGSMAVAQTPADVVAAYLLNARARAELEASCSRSHECSTHDPLTGLPNRILLVERIRHATNRARRSGKIVAVLFADLDRFKLVNDTHGHHAGDQLLVAVAERLTDVLRPGDTLARLAGDEFVILCEDLDAASDADTIAVRIGAALQAPFMLSVGKAASVTASVGIAFAGRTSDLPEEILEDADAAMDQAKRKGGGRYQILSGSASSTSSLRVVRLSS